MDKSKHKIEVIDLFKSRQGDCLTYLADNAQISVTGDFYVDSDNNLHHTHVFPDKEEIEIIYPYK